MLKKELEEYDELFNKTISKHSKIANKIKKIMYSIYENYDLVNYLRVDYLAKDTIEINLFNVKVPTSAMEEIRDALNAKKYNIFHEEDKLYVNFEY